MVAAGGFAMDPGLQLVSFQLLITIIAFVIAVTVHEFSHAFAAYMLGDPTAKESGRLSLNPFAHLDPFGLLFLIIFRFGWALPVPINERNFKYPRLFSVLVGLAGPLSNFAIALLALYGLEYCLPIVHHSLDAFFKTTALINVMLGVFNLIPLAPLDGSHLIRALIPTSWLPYYYTFARYSIFLLLALLLFPRTYLALWHTIEWTYELLESLIV